LPDGRIEFLGRIDHQVKLRGFRIEPGEIEVALLKLSGVAEAVVIPREDEPGEKRLVAYVVGSPEIPLDMNELKSGLRRSLPEYMVPEVIVELRKMPLNASGKIDRAALPVPERHRRGESGDFVAPRNDTEAKVAIIWAEVLRFSEVGIHDSFFDLGGHSLLATQVILRVLEVFGVEVPMRVIFQTRTVAGLAEAIDDLKSDPTDAQPSIEAISRGSRAGQRRSEADSAMG
jgi:acyl carrier protein